MKDVSRETSIFSLFGGEFYLVEVIAFVLKHLKILLVKDLERLKANINLANVHWVLTVPAIWKQEGKQMMREAAHLVRDHYVATMHVYYIISCSVFT